MMNYQHKELAAGRWNEFSFVEKMANIGGEVERASKWKAKNNAAYSEQAVERALELVDLTLESVAGYARRKELARAREALVDYFYGSNQFMSTEASWRKYFMFFAYAARGKY